MKSPKVAGPVTANAFNEVSKKLDYDSVIQLKKFLITLKRGEQIVEQQRQLLAGVKEFEPHAAF